MPNKICALEELFAKTRSAVSEVEDDQDIGFLNEGPIGVTLDTELDIEALIDEAIADRSLASRDLKFDDSQMPRAKNFLEWCTGRHFLKADPYLEQALIGIRLFAEYCPRCSDVEWMDIDNHEPQEGLEGLRQHVTCMEHGHCPKCGVGRAELLRNKELKFYNELAVNAGQRCVTGDTHVLTRNGIERIGAIGADRPYGFSNYCAPVFNGTEFETTSDFYRGREENVYALRLSNGYVLRGTRDHPVETTSGFKTLGAIAQGEVVPVHVNQQCWGTDIPTIEQLKLASEVMFNAKCASTPATNRAQVQNCLFGKARQVEPDLYKVLGFWVAEGRGGFISNMDPAVNEFVYSTLTRYMSKRYVRKYKTGVEVCGFRAKAWLAAALGTTVDDLTSGSAGKRVPDVVLRSPKEYVCSFLQGLFEGDGSCSTGTKRSTGSVSYASISKTLAYDVYTILVNLGIMPSIRERMSWATNGSEKQESKPYWSVSFKSEQCVTRFYEQVGFFSNRKNTKLEKCLDRKRNTQAKNPVKCENYSFLKEEVKSALDSVQTQLNQFELNYAFRSNPEKFRRFKSKKRLGLFTVFGRMGSSVLGCRWDKLFSEDRALTKTKLKFICESILDFDSYLSRESVDKFKFWLDLCHTDTFLLRVKSCTVTADVEETFDFTLPETHKFVTQGVISHNSGKSILVAMLSSYITHQILKVQRPTEVLGIGDNTILHGTFVALTQKQAMDTLWEPYYGYLLTSPWFQKYHALIREYERKYGVEVMKIRDTFVLYRHRSLVVYPAGPDKRVLRGRTRIFSATDEIGWFDNNEASAKVKTSAREVHIALDRSLLTVRAEEQRQIAADFDLAFTGYNFKQTVETDVSNILVENQADIFLA
jgi:intein/homing endonuclease